LLPGVGYARFLGLGCGGFAGLGDVEGREGGFYAWGWKLAELKDARVGGGEKKRKGYLCSLKTFPIN